MKRSKEKSRQQDFLDTNLPDYETFFSQNINSKGKDRPGFLKKIVRINITPIILSLLVYIIQALPIFVTPVLTAEIINIVTNAFEVGLTPEVWQKLGIYVGIIIICLLQNIPTTRLRWAIVSRMLRKTSAGIKSSVVRKMQRLSILYQKDMETGKIQSKFIKDTEDIDTFLTFLVHTLLPNILTLVVYIVISIVRNGLISLFFLFIIPIDVMLVLGFGKRIKKSNHDYRISTENMSSKLNTMLEMMPVTKSHGLENIEIEGVNKSIRIVAKSGLEVDRTNANFGAWMYVVPEMLSIICLAFSSSLALLGHIQVGDIVLFQTLFTAISGYITNLVSSMPQISKGIEALNSVSEIMNAKDIEISLGKSNIPKIEGNIEFENICYRYPKTQANVIDNFNLSVKRGECIAVVGSSGSGKSTLMNLIIGFMFPTSGDLKIDGKSIKDINLTEYRHHISVVPQNSILFSGTIRENITYGLSQYSKEELDKVVEMANLNEFINELPKGLDTNIGEHGGKLSGGQRQRITIARALIRNPSILILDEATSALDNLSELHVQKAISSSIRGRTTFIVAHRLSTIRDADRIVVLEEGKIVEMGTFEQLMNKKGKFYQLKNLSELVARELEE